MKKLITLLIVFMITAVFYGASYAETHVEAVTGTAVVKNIGYEEGTIKLYYKLYGLRAVNYIKLGNDLQVRTEAIGTISDKEGIEKYGTQSSWNISTATVRTGITFESIYIGPVYRITHMDATGGPTAYPQIKGKFDLKIEELYISQGLFFKEASGPHMLEFMAEAFIPIDGHVDFEFKIANIERKKKLYNTTNLGYGLELKYGYKRFVSSLRYSIYSIEKIPFHYTYLTAGLAF